MGADTDGDGLMYDRDDDAESTGVEPTAEEGGEDNE
jgi:hypothetical protein